MMNKFIGIGNLTRDIELRYTPAGTAIGSTGIAITNKFKDNTGTMREETMFIDITFFGKRAETANQYLSKGSRIGIVGKLKLGQWTANDGTKRSKHTVSVEEFEMLSCRDSQGGQGGGTYSKPAQQAPQQNRPQEPDVPEIDVDEDDIPF